MADNELNTVSDELVGDRNALLGVRNVVAEFELDLFAVDAAGCVDVGSGLFSTPSGAERRRQRLHPSEGLQRQ